MLYDVIVVGAGPAGSMAAYKCAKAGLQVLLIDKAPFPRKKPCGGAVSVRSIKTLQLVGIEIPKNTIEQKITGIQLMGPDMTPFVLRASQLLAYIVKRENFDHFLAKQANEAGAQFIDDCPLTLLEQHHDHVICHTKQGSFESRFVIGADGATSKIGRITGLRKPMKPDEIGIALEVDVPISEDLWNKGLDPSVITLWFLNIPFGYFWVFPRKSSLSLGIGGMAGSLGNAPKVLRGFSRMFTDHLKIPSFSLHSIQGHMLPVFERPLALTSNRVLLVGDSAGFIDTFSGQGICYAFESGLLAARTLIHAIKQGEKFTETLKQYSNLIHRRFGAELLSSWTVARLVHSHLYGGFKLARFLKCTANAVFDLALGKSNYYQMKRNPLSFFFKLIFYELQGRLMGTH